MTLFEYLAIAFSLVLSFAAMRLVAGLPYATMSGRRYWVHVVMVCVQVLIAIVAFWNLWSFRDATWTLPTFVLVLASPGLIYFNACTLIPEQASSIESWRNYYYAVRRRFFLGIAAAVLVAATSSTVILQMPWIHPARAPMLVTLAVALIGVSSSNERVHAGVALGFILLPLVLAFTLLSEPGALAP